MVRVECVATQGFVTFTSMPLLTELISIKAGFSYKHGAPNGAVTTRQYRIPLETAKNRHRAGNHWVVNVHHQVPLLSRLHSGTSVSSSIDHGQNTPRAVGHEFPGEAVNGTRAEERAVAGLPGEESLPHGRRRQQRNGRAGRIRPGAVTAASIIAGLGGQDAVGPQTGIDFQRIILGARHSH